MGSFNALPIQNVQITAALVPNNPAGVVVATNVQTAIDFLSSFPPSLISQLLSASALTGTEQIPVNQGGVSRRTTVDDILAVVPPPLVTFLALTDTPDSYSGHAGKVVKVNGSANALEFSALPEPWIYLSDFGVIGDGVVDDTAAINACFASLAGSTGTVIWDRGHCRTTDTIVVGLLTGGGATQSHINIVAHGPVPVGIKYDGPTNRPALTVAKMTNFFFRGLYFLNMGARGTTTGVLLGGPGAGSGNQTNNFQFHSCLFENFDCGVMAGGNNGAASEGTFYHCVFNNNNVGFDSSDFNSLDFTFINLGLSGNDIGLDAGVSNGFQVLGGSGSFNGTDFAVRSNANCLIQGFRSEVADIFVLGVLGRCCTIINCGVVSTPTPFKAITGSFDVLRVIDTRLDNGSITLGTASHAGAEIIEVSGCVLGVFDATRRSPVLLDTAMGQNLTMRGVFRNNLTNTSPRQRLLDFDGMFGAALDGSFVNNPFYVAPITLIGIDRSSSTDFGAPTLALSHIRQLAEGPTPGCFDGAVSNPGKNLRVQGTFASSGTLNFTFVRTVTTNGSNDQGLLTATAGTFNLSDVGKKVFIDDGADTGGDWYGYITEYLTSTTVHSYPSHSSPGQRYSGHTSKTCSIGENEPDANYMVVGLVGNANETFWVTNISATGFTFNSSNASSTATVTALIVR